MGQDLRCVDYRDAVSAELDGEPGPAGSVLTEALLESHLGGCADCRAWAQAAARVTRLTCTAPAEPGPDLVAAVLAAAPDELPPPRPSRRAVRVAGIRAALAVLGVGQLALAVSGITAAGAAATHGGHVAGTATTHFLHESSAWNAAVGVAFLLAALVSARAAALAPVVGAFVGALALLSAFDVVADRVAAARLFTHGLAMAGFLLLVWLRRETRDDDRGRAQRPRRDDERSAGTAEPVVSVAEPRSWGHGSGDGGLTPVAVDQGGFGPRSDRRVA